MQRERMGRRSALKVSLLGSAAELIAVPYPQTSYVFYNFGAGSADAFRRGSNRPRDQGRWASTRLTPTRSEAFLTDSHGRDSVIACLR